MGEVCHMNVKTGVNESMTVVKPKKGGLYPAVVEMQSFPAQNTCLLKLPVTVYSPRRRGETHRANFAVALDNSQALPACFMTLLPGASTWRPLSSSRLQNPVGSQLMCVR